MGRRKEKMSAYPPPESLVLVAVMPELRDLEIARLLGWYRIRLKSAPKVLEVDTLAFYQTGAFGSQHGGRIEHFAALRGHELVTRSTLFRDEPDHPRANEEYYKLSYWSAANAACADPCRKMEADYFSIYHRRALCYLPGRSTICWWAPKKEPVCGASCVKGPCILASTAPRSCRKSHSTRFCWRCWVV